MAPAGRFFFVLAICAPLSRAVFFFDKSTGALKFTDIDKKPSDLGGLLASVKVKAGNLPTYLRNVARSLEDMVLDGVVNVNKAIDEQKVGSLSLYSTRPTWAAFAVKKEGDDNMAMQAASTLADGERTVADLKSWMKAIQKWSKTSQETLAKLQDAVKTGVEGPLKIHVEKAGSGTKGSVNLMSIESQQKEEMRQFASRVHSGMVKMQRQAEQIINELKNQGNALAAIAETNDLREADLDKADYTAVAEIWEELEYDIAMDTAQAAEDAQAALKLVFHDAQESVRGAWKEIRRQLQKQR